MIDADAWVTVCAGAQNLKCILLDREELTDDWVSKERIEGCPLLFSVSLAGFSGEVGFCG